MSKKHKNLYEVIKKDENGIKNVKNINFSKKNLRDDFPILKKYVYLDSAATTQKPMVVIDAIRDFYLHENANSSRGIYSLSVNCSNIIDDVRFPNEAKLIKEMDGYLIRLHPYVTWSCDEIVAQHSSEIALDTFILWDHQIWPVYGNLKNAASKVCWHLRWYL